MLADYDFGSFLWTTLVFFFWFMLIWMFIMVFADILRRRDLSGGGQGRLGPADLHPSPVRHPDLPDREAEHRRCA
jgi:hypothetical protein